MVTVDLTSGDHIIEWSLAGYDPITATINVSSEGVLSCISVVAGTCADMIDIAGSIITGLLKSTAVTSLDDWILSKGGYAAMKGNLSAMGEFIDGYYGITDIGFTPTLLDMGTFVDYYYGVI